MTHRFRGFFLTSLSISVLALTACSTTGDNVSNKMDANRVDAILERAAKEAKASGNKVETLALLEQIYKRNPDDAAVATSFGQALREDEQLNRARQILYPFTEGKNAYPDAVTELAMVQLALGQYKDAELTAKRSVELDPEQGRSYLALGTALDAQNSHEEAEAAFRLGVEKWKGDPAPILNNLALNLASQNKLDQAIDMLHKAQEVSPGRTELERNLRIITTLKESADDFLIKQEKEKQEKIAAAAKTETPKPAASPEKKETKESAKTVEAKADDVKKDSKQAEAKKPAESKAEPKKEAAKAKPAETTKSPAKIEPAAAPKTNARGSRQNFNSKS